MCGLQGLARNSKICSRRNCVPICQKQQPLPSGSTVGGSQGSQKHNKSFLIKECLIPLRGFPTHRRTIGTMCFELLVMLFEKKIASPAKMKYTDLLPRFMILPKSNDAEFVCRLQNGKLWTQNLQKMWGLISGFGSGGWMHLLWVNNELTEP